MDTPRGDPGILVAGRVAVRAGRLTRRRSGEACSASGVERAAVELVVDHVKTDIQVPRDVPLGPATDRPAAGVEVATTRPRSRNRSGGQVVEGRGASGGPAH